MRGAPLRRRGSATALIDGKPGTGETLQVVNPANESQIVGTVMQATAADAERAVASAHAAQPAWDAIGGGYSVRPCCCARRMPSKRIAAQFLARCTLEAGKTLV